MEREEKLWAAIILIVIGIIVFIAITPIGRSIWNKNMYAVQKTDDATNYKTLKNVEDTCRAMLASYAEDKLTWEQYKDSDSKEQRSWADQARMRANSTATSYNEYVLKNSYVWQNNVPEDIRKELEYLK